MIKRVLKTKTFWAVLIAIIVSAEQFATGTTSFNEAFQMASTAIIALFLRDGIAKQKK